jgi:hypothetical protein
MGYISESFKDAVKSVISGLNESGDYDKAYNLGRDHALSGSKKSAPWPKEYPYNLYHKAYNMGYKDYKPKTVKK